MTDRERWIDKMLLSILICICIVGLEIAVAVCLIARLG